MPKVLIADSISDIVCDIFEKNNIGYEKKTGLTEDELALEVKEYEGLLVRSAVTVTKKIIDSAIKLKVIGRPGVGVDNVDLVAAKEKNVVVMNTPLGNVQATAELTFGIIHSLMRKIQIANLSMHSKKWEKKNFIGHELYGKTIGIVGFGNIGKKVSEFARAYGMKIVVFSSSISEDEQNLYQVTNMNFEKLIQESDIVTFHNKLSDKSKYIINSSVLNKMKPSAIIINCARGGIVNESEIKQSLLNKSLGGYGCDVYETEPQIDSIFAGMDNVVMTPHIGASTVEAQEKVAVQIANQVSDYLLNNNLVNQVNI
jgi:D-3-phosphoglycerate dehydrogenase|tara:strand:+ start:340 stop:1281 length:942 start_codon:yes stop_codon:yes gene_type:complete